MNLLRTRIAGLGALDLAEVDLTTLPDDSRVVAVVGANGAGKTTALECALLGAVYRELPTRGSLVDLARQRGACVESDIALGDGRVVRFRQTVDPVNGSGEAAILDVASGETLIASTKVTEADRWVREHLPSLDVVTASLFSAQGSTGILDMRPADRKRLLLRVQGIERIETLAARAGERARAARSSRSEAQARLDEAVRAIEPIAPGALEEAENAVADAAGTVVAARNAVDGARVELDAARARAAAMRAHDEALDRAKREHARARETVAAVEKRLENNRGLLEHESVIRSSHARADELRANVRTHEQAYEALMQANVDAGNALRRALATVVDYERRVAEAERAHAAAAARFDRHQAALAAVPAREAALAESHAADEAHEAALGALSQLRDAQAGRSAVRISNLRGALEDIETSQPPINDRETARSALAADDEQAAREASYPADLAAAEHRVVETRARAARARTALAEARRACEGLDEHASAEYAAAYERLDDLRGELCVARDAHEARDDAAAETGTRLTEASLAVLDARATLLAADSVLRAWPGDVLVRLDQARARVEELEAQLGPARAARDAAEAQEAALAATPPPPSHLDLYLVDLEGYEASLRRAEVAHRERVAEHAALRARVDANARAEARRTEARASLALADRELARWSRLAADLGRDGVQALLVDAAGPALSALVNDLLHACVSTRWTVTIATSRTTKAGEDRETLELRVLDAESGREGTIETYSGGERVLLGEAISLALTVAACRTSGMSAPCLVRDESGAALDAEKARAFVAMLRRAAGMVSAARVMLVTHASSVVAECDAALVVEGGAMRLANIEEVV